MDRWSIKYAIVFFLFTPGMLLAQTEAEQIEAIKHNIDFVYSDYINKDETVARTRAKESLDIEIERYIEHSKNFSGAKGVIIKNIVEKAEEIHLQSGTLHRIFLYIKKKNICPAEVISVVAQSKDSIRANSSDIHPKLNNLSEGKNPVTYLSVESGWKRKFIDNILKCKSYSDLVIELSRGKAEYKVLQIGDEKNNVDAKELFWIVLEQDGSLFALIGPGKNEQINFQTGEKDNISRYNGFKKIWFTLSK